MMAPRMIPVIWIRLLVILGFGIFMLFEDLWVLAVIAAGLALLTVWQLVSAYRQQAPDRSQ